MPSQTLESSQLDTVTPDEVSSDSSAPALPELQEQDVLQPLEHSSEDSIMLSLGGTKGPQTSESPKVVAVVDDYEKSVDLDDDGIPDVSHGEVSERYLQEKGIVTLSIPRANRSKTATLEALTDVLERVERGEEIRAVNISLGISWSLDSLETLSGTSGLTPQNLSERRNEIRDGLDTVADGMVNYEVRKHSKILSRGMDRRNERREKLAHQSGKELQELIGSIEMLEALEARGVDVYLAAGNEEKSVNVLALARGGVDVVGAADVFGFRLPESSRNTLVNRLEIGSFEVKVVEGGIDITRDGRPDFDESVRSSDSTVSQGDVLGKIQGTSIATPVAAAKDLSKE